MPVIVPEKTIKILTGGLARISPDLLMLGKTFGFRGNKKKKQMVLEAGRLGEMYLKNDKLLSVWMTGERAKSGTMSLKGVLNELGIDAKKVAGRTYNAKVRGKKIVVQF